MKPKPVKKLTKKQEQDEARIDAFLRGVRQGREEVIRQIREIFQIKEVEE
jgi:hypothetical protein